MPDCLLAREPSGVLDPSVRRPAPFSTFVLGLRARDPRLPSPGLRRYSRSYDQAVPEPARGSRDSLADRSEKNIPPPLPTPRGSVETQTQKVLLPLQPPVVTPMADKGRSFWERERPVSGPRPDEAPLRTPPRPARRQNRAAREHPAPLETLAPDTRARRLPTEPMSTFAFKPPENPIKDERSQGQKPRSGDVPMIAQ